MSTAKPEGNAPSRFDSSPEILIDPQNRWWVSSLNRLSQVRQGESLPEKVLIRDCTLREGEETPGTFLTDKQKVDLALQIEDVGVQEIEIGYCGAIEEHRHLARLLRDAGIKSHLTSVNRSYTFDGEWQAEVDRAIEAGIDRIAFVAFCNDALLASVPWLPKEAVPDRIFEVTEYARRAGAEVAMSVAGTARTEIHWLEKCARAASAAQAEVIGVTDSNGCATPELIAYLVRVVRDAAGPRPSIAFHGHNTFGLATANAIAAVRAGADVVDTVPLGLGEGAGITPLEQIAFALEVIYGVTCGLEMEKLGPLCRRVKEAFGVEHLPTESLVGSGLFRHSIDSHIASILRGEWHSWECIQPSVLGQERRLEFGYAKIRSGRSGAIGAKVEQMGLVANDDQLAEIIRQVRTVASTNKWATE